MLTHSFNRADLKWKLLTASTKQYISGIVTPDLGGKATTMKWHKQLLTILRKVGIHNESDDVW